MVYARSGQWNPAHPARQPGSHARPHTENQSQPDSSGHYSGLTKESRLVVWLPSDVLSSEAPGRPAAPLTELPPGPHDLRHYFTVRLLDERVPAARARELLAGL
jgi:hypothetical protein